MIVRTQVETTKNGWTVIDRAAGVLTFTYVFNKKSGASANTFTARMANGKLVVISPCCADEDEVLRDLLEFGEVGAVAASNGLHHLGLEQWRRVFPDARFVAPELAIPRIAKKNPDAGALEPLETLAPLLGDDLCIRDAPGTKCGECWAWTKTESGYTWFASDVLANIQKLSGPVFFRALFRLTKSGPGFRLFNLAMLAIVKDKRKLLAALLEDLEAHPPAVLVLAHGETQSQSTIAEETLALVRAAL